MSVRAGFIGVDRHRDPSVRDLTGARRDAAALWALVSDSLEDVDATLLADEDATLENVRDLLKSTLGAASEDDVVILGFAGHGTPDHRLVLHDSQFASLPSTTLDMDELAQAFRASRARVVLCFLDCCFSGGASARVLSGAPATRDALSSIAAVAGRGRILFAASGLAEEAIEDPDSRHGLFTKSILDCLFEATGEVGVLDLVTQVSARVTDGAARMGYVQTPSFFGELEASLSLPPGKRGARFAEVFPELVRGPVSGAFSELGAYGLPAIVLEAWQARFPGGLNSLQLSAVNDHGVLDGRSILTVAPTSAGKTFVGEMAALQAISDGRKAVFLLPFKALVNEKFADFSELYSDQLGLRIARCSGDWQDQVLQVLQGKYDIAFFTYEKFLSLSVAAPHLLRQIGLVVLDEAQFITEPGRGMSVELLLTSLVSARARGVSPQLIALSAVIGDTNGFETWLDCSLLNATARPVPLLEGVFDRSGGWRARDPAGEPASAAPLARAEIRQRREKASSQDVIVPLLQRLVAAGERVIVFRNTRGPAGGCAEYLAEALGLPPAQSALDALPANDLSETSLRLRRSLQGGVAFHTSDLSREERIVVESAFRRADGGVPVLVATSTVAAGVNTPASTVVIVENGFRGAGGETPYTVAQYKNMAGRAGRLGFESQGKAILLADNALEADKLYRRYVLGSPEPVVSSFDERHPETWILRLLAQIPGLPRAAVADLVVNTFGGHQALRRDPSWRDTIAQRAEAIVARMVADGLAEQEGDTLRLTLLGRACGESPLALGSAMRLVELLRRGGPSAATPEGLMVLLQALPERDEDYTPQAGGRKGEANRPYELSQRVDRQLVTTLQHAAGDDKTYYARCKRALICLDWIEGLPLQSIEVRYSPNAFSTVRGGDIRGFADGTRFLMDAASRIAALVLESDVPSDEAMAALLKRLDLGLPEAALPLTSLPAPLTRGDWLRLLDAGLTTETDIREVGAERLRDLIGSQADVLLARLAPTSLAAELTAGDPF